MRLGKRRWTVIWLGLLLALAAGLLGSACTLQPKGRPALPTAVPDVGSTGQPVTTPGAVPPATRKPAGPTSTPAPWATPLPPTPLPTPPKVPHPVVGHYNCRYCHDSPASFGFPPDHKRRTNAMCLGCHALGVASPPAIPHAVTGRERCLYCHLRGDNGAPPEPGDHADRKDDVCQKCHRPG